MTAGFDALPQKEIHGNIVRGEKKSIYSIYFFYFPTSFWFFLRVKLGEPHCQTLEISNIGICICARDTDILGNYFIQ